MQEIMIRGSKRQEGGQIRQRKYSGRKEGGRQPKRGCKDRRGDVKKTGKGVQKTQKMGRKKTGKGIQKDRQGGAKTKAKGNTAVKR